jgi:hypothetical protein
MGYRKSKHMKIGMEQGWFCNTAANEDRRTLGRAREATLDVHSQFALAARRSKFSTIIFCAPPQA